MGRVSKYQLMYSTNGVAWKLYKDKINKTVLHGNSKRNGTVLNILTPEITTRFIRVYPLSYFSFVCMRLELYGCIFGCGEDLSIDTGSIITQSSPKEDQDCLWHVKLPNITKLNFDFINFNVHCSNGYAELRDGSMPYSIATVLAHYCGFDHPPPLVMSNSGEFWVRFKSNASDPQVGFYSVYFPGCGGHLHGSSGEIMSPNFPEEYFHNSKCIWTITVPEGKSVHLKFEEFNVEGDLNRKRCPHDHLTIWNGSDSNAPLIGKYCNSNPPPSFVCCSGNSVRLKFHSDDALAWSGFLITYEVDPLKPCYQMMSNIIIPTTAIPLTISMSLTSTPSITVKPVMTQQAIFSSSSNFVGLILKSSIDRSHLMTVAPSPVSVFSSVDVNATSSNRTIIGFTGTSANRELQAEVQGKLKDADDGESLATVIILSVMAFVVLCMVTASIIPSIKHHYEKWKWVRKMSLLTAGSVSIPETNSKDGFEVAPIKTDDKLAQALEQISRDAISYEPLGLLPVEAAESESLSETPTVEFSNELLETRFSVTSNDVNCEDEKSDEKDGSDTGESVSDENAQEIDEITSLRMSYEDLGSSFACEMEAMLSQLVSADALPEWNPGTVANGRNSAKNDETETGRSSASEFETHNNINDLQSQDDTKSNSVE